MWDVNKSSEVSSTTSELKIQRECILKSNKNAAPSDRVKLKQQLLKEENTPGLFTCGIIALILELCVFNEGIRHVHSM